MAVKVDKEACIGCATCVDACPEAAIQLVDEIAKVNGEKCKECGDCVGACATEAIKL